MLDLMLWMLPRVAGIEDEVRHRPILKLNVDQAGVARRVQFMILHVITLSVEPQIPGFAGNLNFGCRGKLGVKLRAEIQFVNTFQSLISLKFP